ncbi:hypothetical protein CW731_04930 [Polaribacter sp. ALD11]|uniref:peptide chain release factor-like protein n=1 Tax=Polaribacter sp. ALD11 TaxID=2058137 RepID=UPI000C312BD0|nr:peptide chain release factor-like protein [Polaribacter sp. ALD11]AUC84673.1 hypothetical protein CW731_04930 [Polaribacter sp. ALD11]
MNENEIKFQAIGSPVAREQHVNKVSSAIRAKHIKIGVHVLVADSSSQHQNKRTAIIRLQEKVVNYTIEQAKEHLKSQ